MYFKHKLLITQGNIQELLVFNRIQYAFMGISNALDFNVKNHWTVKTSDLQI